LSERLALLFTLFFGSGMTISEALGRRRSDIDLRTRRVSIDEEYRRTLKRESRSVRSLNSDAVLL